MVRPLTDADLQPEPSPDVRTKCRETFLVQGNPGTPSIFEAERPRFKALMALRQAKKEAAGIRSRLRDGEIDAALSGLRRLESEIRNATSRLS
jgi:hypothetical protein